MHCRIKIKFINHLNAITIMAEYQFNSQEVCIFPKENGLYIISVIRYYYTRKNHFEPKLISESNWRWETNCKELVLKLQSNNIRTKAFTQQLIVLAKQFGTLTHKNYTNHAKDYIKQGF